MSRPLDTQIVARARELIADPKNWCQGAMAVAADGRVTDLEGEDAVRFCLAGAIERAASELGFGVAEQMDALFRIGCRMHPDVEEDGFEVIFDINDCRDGHARVLALFDKYLTEARK